MPDQEKVTIKFESLPEMTRAWLSSLQSTVLISEINKRLGFTEEKTTIIPRLIFRLVTQDIEPLDFINELSHELNTSFQTAKTITEEIEIKILRPIENELRKGTGIDIKAIYFGKPTLKESGIIPELKVATPPLTPLPPPPPKPTEPKVNLQSFEIKGPTPFMLHQETVSYPTAQETSAPKMATHIELSPAEKPASAPPKPVSIRVETPTATIEQKNRKTEKQKQLSENPSNGARVVHYSNLRTPLEEKPQMAEQKNRKTEKQNQPMEKPTLLPLPTRKELEASREQENLNAGRTKIVNYSGPSTALTNAGTPKPTDTNTVDLRKMFKSEQNLDEGVVDLRKK